MPMPRSPYSDADGPSRPRSQPGNGRERLGPPRCRRSYTAGEPRPRPTPTLRTAETPTPVPQPRSWESADRSGQATPRRLIPSVLRSVSRVRAGSAHPRPGRRTPPGSRWTVYQLIWAGELPSVHIGRCHRVRAKDVDAYIEGSAPGGRPVNNDPDISHVRNPNGRPARARRAANAATVKAPSPSAPTDATSLRST